MTAGYTTPHHVQTAITEAFGEPQVVRSVAEVASAAAEHLRQRAAFCQVAGDNTANLAQRVRDMGDPEGADALAAEARDFYGEAAHILKQLEAM